MNNGRVTVYRQLRVRSGVPVGQFSRHTLTPVGVEGLCRQTKLDWAAEAVTRQEDTLSGSSESFT